MEVRSSNGRFMKGHNIGHPLLGGFETVFKKGHPIIGGAHSMPHSQQTIERMKVINKAKAKWGENSWNWKGGTGTKRHQEMSRIEYKEWRNKVFERDNYTCQCCFAKKTYFHADHIIEWSENEETRYAVNNGITLCYRCHYKKTFPEKEFSEINALLWGIPKKYRKEVYYCQ